MSEAEATTGLAPEKASVLIHPLVATRKSPSEGFAFDVPLSLVKPLRSGGLGLHNAKNRRAVFARRSFCLSFLELHSAAGIGDSDGPAQRRAFSHREVLHPLALVRGLPTRRLGLDGFGDRRLRHRLRAKPDAQILALESYGDGAVQSFLHPHIGSAQPHPDVLDLIHPAVPAHGIVVHPPLLDVA